MTTETATKTIVLVIPTHAIGANQVGGSYQKHRKHKEQVIRDVGLLWVEAGRPTFRHAIVRPRITFGTPGRRDSANYHGSGTVKFLIDALTQCGAWPDDADKYVTQAPPVVRYVKGVWTVELLIEEAP
jgi:hypothetical protein